MNPEIYEYKNHFVVASDIPDAIDQLLRHFFLIEVNSIRLVTEPTQKFYDFLADQLANYV